MEPALSFVSPPARVMSPSSNREPELEIKVAVLRRMWPVQTDAPLALNAPPGLAELMVRFSLVTCTPLRKRLPKPFTTVGDGLPSAVIVAPKARADKIAT